MANIEPNGYNQWVREAAADVRDDLQRAGEQTDGDEATELIESWAESGSTYTSDSIECIRSTSNDDAVLDVYGASGVMEGIDSITTLYSRIAYFAMVADIREELDRLGPIEEADDDDEDESDDD